MRQRQRQPDSHRERITHGAKIEIRLALGKMPPLDPLAAQGSDNDLIGHLRREPFQAVVANHKVKSSVNSSATGCLSACIMRTASLILRSRPSPLRMT